MKKKYIPYNKEGRGAFFLKDKNSNQKISGNKIERFSELKLLPSNKQQLFITTLVNSRRARNVSFWKHLPTC